MLGVSGRSSLRSGSGVVIEQVAQLAEPGPLRVHGSFTGGHQRP